jgi:hypothetical protein
MLNERRRTPRSPFRCTIEVTDIVTGARLAAVTGDLGLYGCFVETTTPFRRGITVALKITHDGRTFDATGEATYAISDRGMGIAFGALTPADYAVLAGWLARDNQTSALGPTTDSAIAR